MQEIDAIIENATRLQKELEPGICEGVEGTCRSGIRLQASQRQPLSSFRRDGQRAIRNRSQGSKEELERKLLAEARRDFLKVKIEDARQVMSAYQSILSAHSRNVTATGRYTP